MKLLDCDGSTYENGYYWRHLKATGDVRSERSRQITTAVGDGAVAGQEVYKYITEH